MFVNNADSITSAFENWQQIASNYIYGNCIQWWSLSQQNEQKDDSDSFVNFSQMPVGNNNKILFNCSAKESIVALEGKWHPLQGLQNTLGKNFSDNFSLSLTTHSLCTCVTQIPVCHEETWTYFILVSHYILYESAMNMQAHVYFFTTDYNP